MFTMISKKASPFAKAKGEEFEVAGESKRRLVKAMGWADDKPAVKPAPVVKPAPPAPPAPRIAPIATRAMTAEDDSTVGGLTAAKKTTRAYMRRDLKAED